MGKRKKPLHSCTASERELFLKYVGIEKKEEKRVIVCDEKDIKEEIADTSSMSDEELFLSAMDEDLSSSTEWVGKKSDVHEAVGAKAKGRKKNKRNSGPDAVLDLHANTLEIALNRTEIFLKECRSLGKKQLLIIHGKGSGILKEGVRNYLSHHPFVSGFDDAQRRFGGTGAVVVFLK